MLKRMLGIVIFACCATGPAQADTWGFMFRGFFEPATDTFLVNYTITGEFTGEDADGDGRIEAGELTRFFQDGLNYADCPPVQGLTCTIESFRFDPVAGTLDYSTASRFVSDLVQSSATTVTGDYYYQTYNAPEQTSSRYLEWTSETMLTVIMVPEPSAAMLLPAGLLLLALLHRRASGARRQGTV